MPGPARILVVEDEARIAEVVQSYLERAGAHGRDGRRRAKKPSPTSRAVGPTSSSSTSVCRACPARRCAAVSGPSSDVPIIMLTAKDAEEDLVNGLQLGADDYITKPFSPRELTARVRALLRRARPNEVPQADVLERAGGRLVVDSARRRVTLDGELVELTESEFRLLQTLARFPGRVYTRFELVEQGAGHEYEGYERTIDAHVKNLRRKLGDDARVAAARPHGLRPRLRLRRGPAVIDRRRARRPQRLRPACAHASRHRAPRHRRRGRSSCCRGQRRFDNYLQQVQGARNDAVVSVAQPPTRRRTAGTPPPSTRSVRSRLSQQRRRRRVLAPTAGCSSPSRVVTWARGLMGAARAWAAAAEGARRRIAGGHVAASGDQGPTSP